MKFEKQFSSPEMRALDFGKGAKEILKRNCVDKQRVEKEFQKLKKSILSFRNTSPPFPNPLQTKLSRDWIDWEDEFRKGVGL